MPGASMAVKIGVFCAVVGILGLLALASYYVWRKLRRKEDVFSLMRGSSFPQSLPNVDGTRPLPRSEWEVTGERGRRDWCPCIVHHACA